MTITVEKVMDEDLILTTVDNPYDPRKQYDKWKKWDMDYGYNTEEYLARIAVIPDDLESVDDIFIEQATAEAIISILENDDLKLYKVI